MRFLKLLACGVLLAALSPLFSRADLTAPPADGKATAEAIRSILAQQKTITDNQAKIDTVLADVSENVRLARIFSSRSK